MASTSRSGRPADRRRHRHRRRHLARRRQGRQLAQAHGRAIRHPRHHALRHRRPADHASPARSTSSPVEPCLLARALASGSPRWRREEAIAQAGIGTQGRFPRPAVPRGRRRSRSNGRSARQLAQAAGANDDGQLSTICCAAPIPGASTAITSASCSASVADTLADQFGTKGSPISLSTACASGATAIQLGVEAIRRGETEAALCIGTDGSVNPESLVRFSLLSALSTANDPPEAAAKPFAKNRDGFVMAEGAGALVLESLEHARGARRARSSA